MTVAVSPCDGCTSWCCREFHILPTGRDLARIAMTLGLPPSEFISLRRRDEEAETFDVILDPGSVARYRLELRKVEDTDGRRCVFLDTRGGAARCSIYAARPGICRTYPVVDTGGRVAIVRHAPFCPPGSWRVEGIDVDRHRRLLDEDRAARTAHARLIADWSAARRATGVCATEGELLDHILRACSATDAGAR